MTAGRGWAYLGVLLGGGVSIAANVAHSYVPPSGAPAGWHPHAGAVIGAVFWPVSLFVAIEIFARVIWPDRTRWVWLRFAGLAPVALFAAFVSYRHLSGLLAFYGDDTWASRIGPLSVDGLMVMATGALIATSATKRPAARGAEGEASAQPVFTPEPAPVPEWSPMLAPRPPARPRQWPPEWRAEVRERSAAGEDLAEIHESMFGPPPEPFSGEVDLLGERPGSEALDQPCVYRVRDAQDAVIYIGHTVDLVKRIQEHRRLAAWAVDADRMEFQTYRTVDEAAREERIAIQAQRSESLRNVVRYPSRGAQKIRADVPKAAQREQAWRMCAEGKTVAEIRAQFNGDGPSKRTVEYWTQELRDLPIEARAEKLAELLALVGANATTATNPPDHGSDT